MLLAMMPPHQMQRGGMLLSIIPIHFMDFPTTRPTTSYFGSLRLWESMNRNQKSYRKNAHIEGQRASLRMAYPNDEILKCLSHHIANQFVVGAHVGGLRTNVLGFFDFYDTFIIE